MMSVVDDIELCYVRAQYGTVCVGVLVVCGTNVSHFCPPVESLYGKHGSLEFSLLLDRQKKINHYMTLLRGESPPLQKNQD